MWSIEKQQWSWSTSCGDVITIDETRITSKAINTGFWNWYKQTLCFALLAIC
jgi:ribosomal protein S17